MLASLLPIVLACHGHRGDLDDLDLPRGPILPSPMATVYATGESSPRDPIVARVASDLPWDESLSGAAGAVAMSRDGEPDLWLARWSAVRAGYPYPVRTLMVGEVGADESPDDLADQLRTLLRPGEDLGLARARVDETEDRWVALVGSPAGEAAAFDREYLVGGRLQVESSDGDTWALVAPDGEVRAGRSPVDVALDVAGEWWLEIRRGGRTVVSLPVYAGIDIPPTMVVPTPGEEVSSPAEAAALALDLLDEVRESFHMLPFGDDSTLSTLAEALVADAREDRFDQKAAEARLRGAGFVGGPVAAVACHGPTVAACLADIVGSIDGRSAVLQPGLRVAGIASEVRTDGVSLVINLASE